MRITSIVEGHGEVPALPVLMRRLLYAEFPERVVDIRPPIRIKAQQFLKLGEDFRKAIELARRDAGPNGAIFVLLDCEDECPAEVGPRILAAVRELVDDVEVSVALAYREYETWFVTVANSVAGLRGLPDDLTPPPNPEATRGAKEWLSAKLGRPYLERQDQPALTEIFDYAAAARASDSLDKTLRELRRLLSLAPSAD